MVGERVKIGRDRPSGRENERERESEITMNERETSGKVLLAVLFMAFFFVNEATT